MTQYMHITNIYKTSECNTLQKNNINEYDHRKHSEGEKNGPEETSKEQHMHKQKQEKTAVQVKY